MNFTLTTSPPKCSIIQTSFKTDRLRKKEMTLDCFFLAIKGHFWSLLVSNIFCYPLFLGLPLPHFYHAQTLPNWFSLMRTLSVFWCDPVAKGEFPFFDKAFHIHRQFELNFFLPHTHQSISMRYTAVFFAGSGNSVFSIFSSIISDTIFQSDWKLKSFKIYLPIGPYLLAFYAYIIAQLFEFCNR